MTKQTSAERKAYYTKKFSNKKVKQCVVKPSPSKKAILKWFDNVCPTYKIQAMIMVMKSNTMKAFKEKLILNEPMYKHFLKLYGKNFSPHKYGKKFKHTFKTGNEIETTLCQLVFWKWCLTYDILPSYYDFE
jgi:hypothetical protein